MKRARTLIVVLLLFSSVAVARKRDPLTEAEADQLRDARLEPQKRLKLFIKFTDARLDTLDELRSDPKQVQGRGAKIHDLLEDFTSLIDEISSNLDAYGTETLDKEQSKQFHKGTKDLIDATARWTDRLRALRNAIQMDPEAKAESRDYDFTLRDAEDALKSCSESAHDYSEEKNEEKPARYELVASLTSTHES
ncbi:MAG: hypothetical protein ACRD4F_05425 [Candidatus Angelobacter sp.]